VIEDSSTYSDVFHVVFSSDVTPLLNKLGIQPQKEAGRTLQLSEEGRPPAVAVPAVAVPAVAVPAASVVVPAASVVVPAVVVPAVAVPAVAVPLVTTTKWTLPPSYYDTLAQIFRSRNVPEERIHCCIVVFLYLICYSYFENENGYLCARHLLFLVVASFLHDVDPDVTCMVRIVITDMDLELFQRSLTIQAISFVDAEWVHIPAKHKTENYFTDLTPKNFYSFTCWLIGIFHGYIHLFIYSYCYRSIKT
jgi:hypothetical protein